MMGGDRYEAIAILWEVIMEPISPHTVITAARAARAAGGSFFTIKNYIKRGVLLYPGQESRAGQPRAFLVWGAYEFAVLTFLQRQGLSLDAARAVWREIIRLKLVDETDADRAAKGDETLMTFEELNDYKRKHWSPHADNTPPRNLPDILSGDLNGPIAAIRIKSHQHGVVPFFEVSIRPISRRFLVEWGQKWPGEWQMLVGSQEQAEPPQKFNFVPPENPLARPEGHEFDGDITIPVDRTQLLGAALFVNLNAVIWQVNQALAAQANENNA